MKRWIFAVGVLALSLAAARPALADYAIVRFGDGHCQIWANSADNPWGADWAKIAVGLPDYAAASAILGNAIAQGVCR